jgi:hypothetical protein
LTTDDKPHKNTAIAKAIKKPFSPFVVDSWIHSQGLISSLWQNYGEASMWNNEADIKARVRALLADLVAYSGLRGQVSIQEEVSFFTHHNWLHKTFAPTFGPPPRPSLSRRSSPSAWVR